MAVEFEGISWIWVLFGSLWLALLLYRISALWWLIETLVLSRGWNHGDDTRWTLDDVQVRVLTIGAEAVVQGTVQSVPDEIGDVRVVSERELSIDGVAVHVVPDEYDWLPLDDDDHDFIAFDD